MPHRIFVFGATGYLGGAIASRLARDGHTVYGLTRSEDGARALSAAGIRPVHGALDQPSGWVGVLHNADVAIQAALDHDDARGADHGVLEAVRTASQDGRIRRFLYTSGVWDYGPSDTPLDETAALEPGPARRWRVAHHDVVFDLADHDVAATVFQPGIVYGESRGLLAAMFAAAREHGVVPMPGDGSQRWPMIHREDLADAYARALDSGPAGSRLLLSDGSEFTVREIAEAIARVTGARVQPQPVEDLPEGLRGYGALLLRSQRVDSGRARAALTWAPAHTSFVAEATDLYGEWRSGSPSPVG